MDKLTFFDTEKDLRELTGIDTHEGLIKKCKTFSLFVKNKLRENVTVDWIMKNLPVNQAIQYLIERGMGICPITQTKSDFE